MITETNNLIELIDKMMDKKPRLVVENTVNNYGTYKVEIYLASDPEDKVFISGNKRFIKDFFDKGYERAGIGPFAGCLNANSVKSNTSMLKVARDAQSNEIIAMTIYSSRWGGFKCVGGTITTEPTLRPLGRQALYQITREDIKLIDQFIWTECSGKIRELWNKYGGIKIPNSYLPMFMDEKTLQTIEIEEGELYKYSRIVNRGEADELKVEKEIYGFPNKDVLEKYIQETDSSLEELLKKVSNDGLNEAFIQEHINYRSAPKDMWTDLRILKHFTESFKKTGNTTLTEREMQVLTISANNVYNGLERYWGHIKSDDEKALFHLMVTAMEIANISTIIKPYELGELLEPETLKFGLDKMFTDCLY